MKPRAPRSDHSREWSRYGALDFAFWLPASFLVFLGVGAAMQHLPPAIPSAYAIASVLSGFCYARDKTKAQRAEWRTPETVLHAVDFLGGWPGGLIAQRVYRHKTRKLSFQIIFWMCAVVHLVAWAWIFVSVPAEKDLPRFLASALSHLASSLWP